MSERSSPIRIGLISLLAFGTGAWVFASPPQAEVAIGQQENKGPARRQAGAVSPYFDGRHGSASDREGIQGQGAGYRGGTITLDVFASSAPNAFGSPSWSGYLVNALYALENNLAMNGDRATDPTGYERAPSQIPPGEIAVTSFNSWRGVVSPPAPFSGEYGNRMHFGLHAYGDGTALFTLEDLTFQLHSDDPYDSLVFAGNFIGFTYNGTTRYGIHWGADRAKGGIDDTIYTSGNGTTPVDEIVYVGVGNAWWPSVGTPQDAMDDYFSWVSLYAPINVTCTYAIQGFTGTDSVQLSPVIVDDFGVEGWKSDDTRNSSGTDLVGTNYTHYGKPGQAPTAADDTAIAGQIQFVNGPDDVPALMLTKSGPGFSKCTLSKVDTAGFDADDWRGGFFANYRYYAGSSIEAGVLKIGIRSPLWGTGSGQSQNGFTAVRSGESVWDLILVDWRGTNPGWTIGAWDRFETDADTQCWRIFRQGTNSFFNAGPNPPGAQIGWSLNELYAMTDLGTPAHVARTGYTWSEMLFGTGVKVVSVQFGVGSSTGTTTSYIDYVDTSLLNGGNRVDFVGPLPIITTIGAYPSQVPDEQEPQVNLGDAPLGFGPDSWRNSATGKVNWHARYNADGNYLSALFPSQAATLTVNDLESILYWTKRPVGTAAGRDWLLFIYTRPPGDASWYGKRFVNNYDAHTETGVWTHYSTDSGMTFKKNSGTPTGHMDFATLKATYGTELIEMISVQTDSGWGGSGGFDGSMDGLTIVLTDGSVGHVDFVLQPTMTLEPDDECYAIGETVTVEVRMNDVPESIVGGQFFLQYDQAKLDFLSADPGDSPFTIELYESVVEGSGTIDYSVNAPGGDPGASGTATLAVLTFSALSEICTETNLITWRAHDPPSRLSDSLGGSVNPTLLALDVSDTEAPVLSGCPATPLTVECDSIPAAAAVTAMDNCDSSVAVDLDEDITPGACTDSYTLTRTWTATDDCGNSASCMQVITVQDTTDPVIDCPDNVTIECSDSTSPLSTGVTLSMPFDANPTLSATQAPGVWYVDRYSPFGFVSSFFDGDNRLKHSIDASDGATSRPPAYSSAFYNTQGRKYDLPSGTTRMTIDLYVPSGWAGTGLRMAGLWGTGLDIADAVSAFPIIEFTSTTDGTGVPRFRGWDNGVWVDLGLPTGFAYDDWTTLEIELVGSNWRYKVGDLQTTVPALGSVRIGNVILQGHNTTAGVTYDIYWDNFTAAQTTQATDNCDGTPSVTYVDVPSLGGCNGTGSIARTWTATDNCGNSTSCVQTITVVDTTDPVITFCPADVTIGCHESTVPALPYGTASGGVMVYYNTPLPEIPSNQAYMKAQVSQTNTNGAAWTYSSVPLTGSGFTWALLWGQVGSPTQFGFDMVLEAPTASIPIPYEMAYNNTDNTIAGRAPAGLVRWMIDDYKPHAGPLGPTNPLNDVINSQVRSVAGPNVNPLVDIEIVSLNLVAAPPIFTMTISGVLHSDGIHHWYTPATPDSPMAIYGLNGDFYFSGTLTYDSTLDVTPGGDFYAGSIAVTANSPTTSLGFALATDNCQLFPVVTYSDDISGLTGCNGTGTIVRTWTATDACGNVSTCEQTITVVDTTDPVIGACPADITVPADAGGCDAVVTYAAPSATDNCDSTPTVVCTPPSGSTFASGTTPVTCTATDDCGNSSQCSFDVTVLPVNEMVVNVQLSPTMAVGPFTRCITFELWECPNSAPTIFEGEVLSFSGGMATTTVDVACGDYTCITARDRRHTLRRTDESFHISGTQYVADFTGSPPGGDWLIGGNLNDDFWVDILDFGVFTSQWLVNYGSGNTTCATGFPHADITGDGIVNVAEFTFIQINFLKGHEANCCGAAGVVASEDGTSPISRISVLELEALGMGELVSGDLNGDGWVDSTDVESFAMGARPELVEAPHVQPSDAKRDRTGGRGGSR